MLRLLGGILLVTSESRAVDPWPAEAHTSAIQLTSVDAGLNTVNWSGAFWNPETRTLWLACNSGYFWALVENGAGGFRVATNASGTLAKWSPGGDLESIGQVAYTSSAVFLMDEDGWIKEYDASQYGVVSLTRSWDIRAHCAEVGGSGSEGLAFVPDEWLRRQQFTDTNGIPRVSTNGMGGLMLIGHQSGGYVHAFDLNPTNTQFGYVGRYKTGRSETAGLEFDRASGKFYVWHNTGDNYLEVVGLQSYPSGTNRVLRPLAEYYGPRTGNLEGFALTPSTDTNTWCFITDDDNSGGEAVMWYREFAPSDDVDADELSDGYELWHFGSLTQTTGSADADLDGLSNTGEWIAGTDPTNDVSSLALVGPVFEGTNFVLSWASTTGRVYAVCECGQLNTGFAFAVTSGIRATVPLNVSTMSVPPGVTSGFYRISVQSP